MNMKPLPGIICILLLAGCTKLSSIDGRKTGAATPRMDAISTPASQLTDRDVFGDELTLDITEEDIENAVEEASNGFEIPQNSAIILVESGSRAPDVIMQKEMQRYYRVSTFSGIPVARKKGRLNQQRLQRKQTATRKIFRQQKRRDQCQLYAGAAIHRCKRKAKKHCGLLERT